ncbi:hypothetical protein Hdeb2414_s0005g00161011 [Helianthus debilis subsp. tardiflorus]
MRNKAEREREIRSRPHLARLPHTETKSPSLGFPARVPIKFWQFPVTSGEVPENISVPLGFGSLCCSLSHFTFRLGLGDVSCR